MVAIVLKNPERRRRSASMQFRSPRRSSRRWTVDCAETWAGGPAGLREVLLRAPGTGREASRPPSGPLPSNRALQVTHDVGEFAVTHAVTLEEEGVVFTVRTLRWLRVKGKAFRG